MKKRSLNDIIQLIVLVIMIVTGSVATIVFLFDLKNHLPVSIATDEDLTLEEFLQIGDMFEDYLDVEFESLSLLNADPIYFDSNNNIYSLDLVIGIQIQSSYKVYSITYTNEQVWIQLIGTHEPDITSILTLSYFIEVVSNINSHWGSEDHVVLYSSMVYPQIFTTSGSANYVWIDGDFAVADDTTVGDFIMFASAHDMQELLDNRNVNYFFPVGIN